MRDKHVPHDEFVDRLAAKIGRDVRRRNAVASSGAGPGGGLVVRWSLKTAAALASVVIVSMAIGGAVVAAAYEAQQSEQGKQVASSYQRRLVLAQESMNLAKLQLEAAQQQIAVGLGSQEALLDARAKLTEAQSELTVIQLQLEEIRLTSREPGMEISSPLVSGRDFVTERLRVEMNVPTARAEAERTRLQSIQQRVELGVANPADTRAAEIRLVEAQTGVESFRRRLDIRQRFLKGEYDAPMAELRILEATTELRRKAMLPKIDAAKFEVDRLAQRVETGMASPLDRSQAQLKLLQLQTDLLDLDVQLAMVQKQIAARKK